MNKRLRISTLNCQGLNKLNKILLIKDMLRVEKVDIGFLQETHIAHDENRCNLVKHLHDYNVFCELSEDKTRGVAIIIKKTLNLKVENFRAYNNRCISLDIKMDGRSFNLFNVYAPNLPEEQISFIEDLTVYIANKRHVVLGGDFNFVEDNLLDRNNVEKNTNNKLCRHQKIWIRFLRTFRLRECFLDRKRFADNTMTWSNGIQSSRIDRFYFCKDNDISLSYHNNIYMPMSDHQMLTADLSYSSLSTNKSYPKKDNNWKLNESVLDDPLVNESIISICNQIPEIKLKHGFTWYEEFIQNIIKLLKRESRRINNLKNDRINFLFEKLSVIRSMNDKEILDQVKSEISNYYKEKRKGIEARACEIKRNFVNQPSKVLIEKEKFNVTCNEIDEYKTRDNILTDDNGVILEDLEYFYKDLMGQERVDSAIFSDYEFAIKPLDYSDRRGISKDITLEEAEKALKSMKGAAPGPNGLTIGFYKKYFHLFGKDFIEILNDHSVPLTKTFNEIKIKLIPKNDKTKKSIDDLRPISLTNYEYRLFTKILTVRLNSMSYKIIGEHQSCSIKGRRMSDNITLTRDIIHFSNLRNKKLNLISVDQRKAFDSISHTYLFKLLEHLNMGDFLLSNIKRLYSKSYATIIANQHQSNRFDIKSGIKQGCALSMVLYVIAIEELLLKINRNTDIKGIKMDILKPIEIKSSAYADDIVGYVTDNKSIDAYFNEFYNWEKFSGASINQTKTKIVVVNGDYENNNYSLAESVKILGIIFDKKGISRDNYSNMNRKLKDALFIWNSTNISLIERVVACKTFLLSKVWFLATFCIFSKKDIKSLNSIIFSFIWNNKSELIKRNTLILPYEEGGLGMFNLHAKLQTIAIQQLIYIARRHDRIPYQLSVYFLKFYLKELNMRNFNIIPSSEDSERPAIYQKMIDTLKIFKNLDHEKPFSLNNTRYSSRACYTKLRKVFEFRPEHQSKINLDWIDVYKKTLSKSLDSRLREVNYRVIYNALSLGLKFTGKMNNRCYFCKNQKEDQDHLFINCKITENLFNQIRKNLNQNFNLTKLKVFYSVGLDKNDLKIMSVFKYTIWSIRNIIRKGENLTNLHSIFEQNFNSFLRNLS